MLRFLAALAALAAIVVPAATAQAASFSNVEGRMHVATAPGEKNHITIRPTDTGPIVVRDDGPGITPTGCPEYHPWENDVPGDLLCQGGFRAPVIDLGDQDDNVSVSDAGTEDLIGTTEVDAGPGDDHVTTASSSDVLLGGEGDDTLWAGEWGEDRLEGGPGVDNLSGMWGDDTLVGGPGLDELAAGEGDDTIDAADGEQDTVSCAEGVDTVTADRVDVLTACENVTRVGAAEGGGGGGSSSGGGGSSSSGGGSDGSAAAPAPAVAPAPPAATLPTPIAAPAVDRLAPRLKIRRNGRVLTLTCDEACTVRVRVAGRRALTRKLQAGRAKRVRIPGKARTVKLSVRDAAGNVRAATRKLAKQP